MANKTEPMTVRQFRLDDETFNWAFRHAASQGRTFSEFMRFLIKQRRAAVLRERRRKARQA